MRTLRWTPLLLIYACAGMGESPPPPSGGGTFGTATSGSDDVKEEVVVTSGRGGGGSWGAKRSVPTAPALPRTTPRPPANPARWP
ncbi:MAG: hypothetical protein H6730_08445 [Deltaproteobacteria bacterium]|nr:hypothetical protein [Deltaproteobacteria bacterium]